MNSNSRRILTGLLAGCGLLAATSRNAGTTIQPKFAQLEQLDSADLKQMGIDTATVTDEWRIEKLGDTRTSPSASTFKNREPCGTGVS